MDEIDGLPKGSRCKKFKVVDGVRRCAAFRPPRKKTAKKAAKKRRSPNKGKVCIKFKSYDGVRRCSKFGSKSAAKKTAKKSTKKAAKKSSKKSSKSRPRASQATAVIEIPREQGLTFAGKIRKGCRPMPKAKGKLLCTPEAVARITGAAYRSGNVRSDASLWDRLKAQGAKARKRRVVTMDLSPAKSRPNGRARLRAKAAARAAKMPYGMNAR